ncbi:hypothetical protein D3C76_891140 [compost metagenome]
MENVHARVGQRLEELAQGFRGLHQTCGVVLLLPLGETEDDRETFTDRGTHGLNQFNGEARTVGQAAAVFVGALVAAFPEELVDQVAVGAVDLHAVHADGLGVAGGLGEGGDDFLDVLVGHLMDQHVAVLDLAARAVARHARIGLGAQAADCADMPELRDDLAAFGMYRIDHLLPAGQGVLVVEARYVRVAIRGLVPDQRAFGDDQADTGGGAAAVVLDHLRVRHAARAEVAGHRCHHHAGRQFQGSETERLEQGLNGCTH